MTANESQLTINNLPEEILLEIFEFLDSKDLKSAVLVCKNWDKLISSNTSTMRKLPLLLSFQNETRVLETLDLIRTFTKIKLFVVSLNANILAAIQKHRNEVRQLIVNHTHLVDTKEVVILCRILMSLPKLQELTIQATRFGRSVNAGDVGRLRIESLKRIIFNESDCEILKLLDVPNLVSLKLREGLDPPEGSSLSYSSSSFPRLKELAIICDTDPMSPVEKLDAPARSVKKLCVSHPDSDFVASLLNDSKNTLEKLEIGLGLSPLTIRLTFRDLSKLHLLKVHLDHLPAPSEMTGTVLRPNRNVKTLIVTSVGQVYDGFGYLIENVPNLDTLVLDCDLEVEESNRIMALIAAKLPRLRVLEVRRLGKNSFENVNIQSLTELCIYEFHTRTRLSTIAKNCPNLKKLSIETVLNVTFWPKAMLRLVEDFLCPELIYQAIPHLGKLEELHVGEIFTASREFMDHLLANCPNLKILALTKHGNADESIVHDFKARGGSVVFLNENPLKNRTDFCLLSNEHVVWNA